MQTSILNFGYQHLLKPLFFKLDPELAHERIGNLGHALGQFSLTRDLTRSLLAFKSSLLTQKLLGTNFANPVGLSEGFDKTARLMRILPEVGFGYGHIGSITLQPWAGNSKPRLYRLPEHQGLIVNYGLMNKGVEHVLTQLEQLPKNYAFPLSISVASIAREGCSSVSDRVQEYCDCLTKLSEQPRVQFLTVNISCPNVVEAGTFLEPANLASLLSRVCDLRLSKPVLVKMPADLEWEEFHKLLEVTVRNGISGVIVSNLTKDTLTKSQLGISAEKVGGVSGKILQVRSNYLIGETYRHYGKQLIIIGAGGVFSAEDAYEKIKLGASLVQLITGMIYEGPQLIGQLNRGLVELLIADGYTNIQEAIGANWR